jgi:hypothetical protein
MEQPIQTKLAQLTAAERMRVIAILVQMVLHQLSKPVEEKTHDPAKP